MSTPIEDEAKSGPTPIPTNDSRNVTSPTEVTSNQQSTENVVDVDNEGDDERPNKRLRYVVWKHFIRQEINGAMKAICHYCNKKLGGVGMRHLIYMNIFKNVL